MEVHTGTVVPVRSLCPSTSTIDHESERKYYWSQLLAYWRLPSHVAHFPGANPVSIERADGGRLRSLDFVVALKTDGVRHILLLTLKPNSNEPIALMIDRTQKMYEVQVWASEEYFVRGTLMDGELVWHDGGLLYVVFDVMLTKGASCVRMPYRDRLQVLHNTILVAGSSDAAADVERRLAAEDKLVARNNAHGLCILPKRCVPKENIRSLWDDRHDAAHANDGLIFTLNGANVSIGTCDAILKWKPTHTIDVQVASGATCADVERIYVNGNTSGRLIEITQRCGEYATAFHRNRLIEVIVDRLPAIVECNVRIEGECMRLTPVRERGDKTAPNTMKTVAATIRNTLEQISCEELISMVTGDASRTSGAS